MTNASTTMPGWVKKLLKDGTITVSIAIKCRMTDVVMVIPCWRNFFLFLSITATSSNGKTAISIAKLIVASVKVTITIAFPVVIFVWDLVYKGSL